MPKSKILQTKFKIIIIILPNNNEHLCKSQFKDILIETILYLSYIIIITVIGVWILLSVKSRVPVSRKLMLCYSNYYYRLCRLSFLAFLFYLILFIYYYCIFEQQNNVIFVLSGVSWHLNLLMIQKPVAIKVSVQFTWLIIKAYYNIEDSVDIQAWYNSTVIFWNLIIY